MLRDATGAEVVKDDVLYIHMDGQRREVAIDEITEDFVFVRDLTSYYKYRLTHDQCALALLLSPA